MVKFSANSRIYEKLISKDGLRVKDLKNKFKVGLNKCGGIHFSSGMFENSAVAFDVMTEEKSTWYDGYFTGNQIHDIYVKSGTIDGIDVAGKLCTIYTKTPNAGTLVKNFECNDHSGKNW